MKTLLFALLAVFAPIQSTCLAALAVVLADLLTGLEVAHKTKQPVTSAGLKRTLVKLACYQTAILSAFLVGTYLTGPVIPLTNIVAGFIGITELKSVLENLDVLNDGQGVFAQLNRRISNVAENSDDNGTGHS